MSEGAVVWQLQSPNARIADPATDANCREKQNDLNGRLSISLIVVGDRSGTLTY
jgi:hypothetical protein